MSGHVIPPDTWTWTQPQVNGWIAPRTAFGAAVAENKLYVFGGQSAHGALNDLHYLDLGKLTFSPIGASASLKLAGLTLV